MGHFTGTFSFHFGLVFNISTHTNDELGCMYKSRYYLRIQVVFNSADGIRSLDYGTSQLVSKPT
jgi:hypothetical protein